MAALNYVIGILGLMGTVAAAFVAGWIVGPRVLSPLAAKILGKVNDAVQSSK